MKDIAIYIHIPFCERKCFYCDFISFPKDDRNIEIYTNYLIKELALYKDRLKDHSIKTIFIGGGTPSAIHEKNIYRILEFIYKNFNTENLIENTIEINPGTINKNKIKTYKDIGINRVSLGVQSLDNEILKSIGRIHTAEDFYNSYNLLRNAGIDNINVDLILGLPGQNLNLVTDSLFKIIELGVEHISYYGLILEDNTPMTKLVKKGKLILPSEEEERTMYHKSIEVLQNHGYKHYEISNFAKQGFESIHNKFYWKVKPYIGVGLNSHSNFQGRRYWNFEDFDSYYQKIDRGILPIKDEEIINKEMEMAEFMILGLRIIEGVNKKAFLERFGAEIHSIYGEPIEKHKKTGLLIETENWIKLSQKGLDLSNQVEIDFFPNQ